VTRGPSAHGLDPWASTGFWHAPRQLAWMPGTRACPRAARSADPWAGHGRTIKVPWVHHLFEP
jgi:hypothetical protein